MPKISDLTVADLRGACAQIEDYLVNRLGFEKAHAEVEINADRATVNARVAGAGVPKDHQYECPWWVQEWDTLDGEWDHLLAKVWAAIAKHQIAEVREIRSVMEALGSAIEILDKSRSEFAADLAAGIKRARDDAGARLIEYQQAAE